MDKFREWLSDNLRYIMLIAGILILLVLIFFGIRAVSQFVNDDTENPQTNEVGQDDNQSDASDTTATPTATPTEALEKNAYPEINSLINSYYTALGAKDVDTLRTLVNDLNPTEESKITNSQYIEGYSDVEVYTKNGMTDDTYVVFAKYNYICTGIATPVPALSQLYVIKEGDSYKISPQAETDASVQSYISDVLQNADVQQLVAETETAYEQAQESDPALKSFLENLGTQTTPTPVPTETAQAASASSGATVTANDYAYVRSGPGGSYDVIGGLDLGQQVEKTGEDGFWTQIVYEGQTGYVFSEYVD